MKKLLPCFVVLLAGLSFSLSAQTANSPSKKMQKAAPGTYQFIISNSKSEVAFAEEIYYEIERNRDEKDVKYLQLGSQTKVKILPFAEINSSGFVPIKEEVIFLGQANE